jgi:hypothetical protein
LLHTLMGDAQELRGVASRYTLGSQRPGRFRERLVRILASLAGHRERLEGGVDRPACDAFQGVADRER